MFDGHLVASTVNGLQATRLIYFASSVVCVTVFWLCGGPPIDPGFPILNNLPLWYQVLPLSFLALVLAATRPPRGVPALQVVAAVAWFVTLLALGLWHPMFRSVDDLGSGVLDGLATLSGLSAVAMMVLGIQPLVSRRARPSSVMACSLEIFGLGALALYLAQISFTFWAATRLYPSGGIDRMFAAARENVAMVFAIATVLVASRLAEGRAPRVRVA